MASLYELTSELLQLQHYIEADDGELTPETESAIEAIAVDLKSKAQGYCQIMRNLETFADGLKAEEDRLKALRQIKENAARRLKDRLHECMVKLGMLKIETPLFKLSVCKNSRPSIKWTGSMDELPKEYQRIKVEVDNDAAYQDVKAGKDLPSQFEVNHGTHLRIK